RPRSRPARRPGRPGRPARRPGLALPLLQEPDREQRPPGARAVRAAPDVGERDPPDGGLDGQRTIGNLIRTLERQRRPLGDARKSSSARATREWAADVRWQ